MIAVLLIFTLLAISSSQDSYYWPMFHRDTTHTGKCNAPLKVVNQTSFKWAWIAKGVVGVASSPITDGSTVYFGDSGGYIYAMRISTGNPVWQYQVPGPIISTPALLGNLLLVASDNKYLYAFDKSTGAPVWTWEALGSIVTSLLVYDQFVYFGSHDGVMQALKLSSQGPVQVWDYQTGGPIFSTPAADFGRGHDILVFGSVDKTIYAIHATNGKLAWIFRTPSFFVTAPVILPPSSTNQSLVILASWENDNSAGGGSIYAMDYLKGTVVWRAQGTSVFRSSPAYDPDNQKIYVGDDDGYLWAVSAIDGIVLWKFKTGAAISSSPAILGDGTIVFGSDDSGTYCVSSAGKQLWASFNGRMKESSPAIGPDGTIFIGCMCGSLFVA